MKILLINDKMHFKNLDALMKYKKVEFVVIDNYNINDIDLTQFDAVYSPCGPIQVSKYPNVKFLFGPHFSVFPNSNQMKLIKGPKTVYVQPSEWASDVWINNDDSNGVKIKTLPFGVDTETFHTNVPIENRIRAFIYFKQRDPIELDFIVSFLKERNIECTLFDYVNKYKESDYINCLKNSKFGIWIGRHESQGFALEEALSFNVPLIVWNVKSMNQEYRSRYSDIMGTTIPYWDNRCGESFYYADEFENKFKYFISNLYNYKPREYILETISIEKCEQKFIDLVNSI
jgi:hypothetical protein